MQTAAIETVPNCPGLTFQVHDGGGLSLRLNGNAVSRNSLTPQQRYEVKGALVMKYPSVGVCFPVSD